MSWQKKSKIFKTFLVVSIVFTNFSFFNTLNRTTNYRIDKHFELTGNDKNNQPNISESIFDFAWLEKYKNDKNFADRDFNAYISGRLIERSLVDQYLVQAKVTFFDAFQKYILSYENLKFTYINHYCYYDNVTDNSIQVQKSRTIKFDLNYFEQWIDKFDLNTIFDRDKLEFVLQTDPKYYLCNDIISCFLSDDICGIYYIDDKDKANENNEVNEMVKSKIELLKIKMNYVKKQLLVLKKSLTQPKFCINEEINELNLYLSRLVCDMKKLFDYTAIKTEIYDRNYREIVGEDNIREAFNKWVDDYDIKHSLAYNDHYWFLSEEDAFFSYLSSNKKKYVNYGDVNFKKGIADFLCAAKLNYAIDTFEKAVASYIIASQNNKNIISSSIFSSTWWRPENWEEAIFRNWDAIVKWITIITGALAFFYCSCFVPLNWLFAMPINVTPLKITKASNNILPSSFKKFSSLTNLFGDLLGRAPSLDSVLGHSPNKSIIDGIITNNISGLKIPQIINGISSAINAGRFGMILHNFLKFISSKKYSDTGAIDSLTHREIFEMIEEGFIGKQNNKPSPSHDKPKKNIIKKNDDEEIKMEIFRIIRDLFEDEHPPMVNRYEQAGGDIFFVDISNTSNNLQQHLSSAFSGTQLIFSKNIVENVLSKLGYDDDNEKCEYYKPIIIRCLIEYLNRQKVDIKNTDMDDILRIPWLYCPDKNLSDEIRKIDDLTSGKNKSWFDWLFNLFKKNDKNAINNKIIEIFKSENRPRNLPSLYYFNSNLWIDSIDIPETILKKMFVDCSGDGFIPFSWVLLPILRMVKEEQNPFMAKEKQNQSMEDELAKIKLIISCFNIEENIDEKINFNHIAKIFDGATLQTRVVDNEVLYLLRSLPSSIQNEISQQFNEQLTVVDNEQFVKMHFILPVIKDILTNQNLINLSSIPGRLHLQDIIKFYFKKLVKKHSKKFTKKFTENEIKDIIFQRIDMIFKNKFLFFINDTKGESYVSMFLPWKIQTKLPKVNEQIPELVDLNQIVTAIIEILENDEVFHNANIFWANPNYREIISNHLKTFPLKPNKEQINEDGLNGENKTNKSILVEKLINRFIDLSKGIKIMVGYDLLSKQYTFYTKTTYLPPLIRDRMIVGNSGIIKDNIAIPFSDVLRIIIAILKEDEDFHYSLSYQELEMIINSYYYESLKEFICTDKKIDNIDIVNDINQDINTNTDTPGNDTNDTININSNNIAQCIKAMFNGTNPILFDYSPLDEKLSSVLIDSLPMIIREQIKTVDPSESQSIKITQLADIIIKILGDFGYVFDPNFGQQDRKNQIIKIIWSSYFAKDHLEPKEDFESYIFNRVVSLLNNTQFVNGGKIPQKILHLFSGIENDDYYFLYQSLPEAIHNQYKTKNKYVHIEEVVYSIIDVLLSEKPSLQVKYTKPKNMFFGIYKEKNELFTLIMQIIKSNLIDPAVERGDDTINYYDNDDYYNKIESQIFNEAINEMNLDILKKDNRLKDFVYIDNNINKIDAIDGIDINITNYGDIKKPNYFAIVKYIDQIFNGSTPIFSQYFWSNENSSLVSLKSLSKNIQERINFNNQENNENITIAKLTDIVMALIKENEQMRKNIIESLNLDFNDINFQFYIGKAILSRVKRNSQLPQNLDNYISKCIGILLNNTKCKIEIHGDGMDELGEAREVYLFLYNSLPDIIRKQHKKNDDSEYIQHYSIIPLIINILLQKVPWIKEEYPVKHNDPFKYGYDDPLYRLIINNIHDLVHASTKIEAGLVTIKLPKDKYIEEEIFDEEINRMNLEQQKDDGKVTRKFIYVKQGIDNNEIINEDWDDINDGIVGIDNVKKSHVMDENITNNKKIINNNSIINISDEEDDGNDFHANIDNENNKLNLSFEIRTDNKSSKQKIIRNLLDEIFNGAPLIVKRIITNNTSSIDSSKSNLVNDDDNIDISSLPTGVKESVVKYFESDKSNFFVTRSIVYKVIANILSTYDEIINNGINDNELLETIKEYFRQRNHFIYEEYKIMENYYKINDLVQDWLRKVFNKDLKIKTVHKGIYYVSSNTLPEIFKQKLSDFGNEIPEDNFYNEVIKQIKTKPEIKNKKISDENLKNYISDYFHRRRNKSNKYQDIKQIIAKIINDIFGNNVPIINVRFFATISVSKEDLPIKFKKKFRKYKGDYIPSETLYDEIIQQITNDTTITEQLLDDIGLRKWIVGYFYDVKCKNVVREYINKIFNNKQLVFKTNDGKNFYVDKNDLSKMFKQKFIKSEDNKIPEKDFYDAVVAEAKNNEEILDQWLSDEIINKGKKEKEKINDDDILGMVWGAIIGKKENEKIDNNDERIINIEKKDKKEDIKDVIDHGKKDKKPNTIDLENQVFAYFYEIKCKTIVWGLLNDIFKSYQPMLTTYEGKNSFVNITNLPPKFKDKFKDTKEIPEHEFYNTVVEEIKNNKAIVEKKVTDTSLEKFVFDYFHDQKFNGDYHKQINDPKISNKSFENIVWNWLNGVFVNQLPIFKTYDDNANDDSEEKNSQNNDDVNQKKDVKEKLNDNVQNNDEKDNDDSANKDSFFVQAKDLPAKFWDISKQNVVFSEQEFYNLVVNAIKNDKTITDKQINTNINLVEKLVFAYFHDPKHYYVFHEQISIKNNSPEDIIRGWLDNVFAVQQPTFSKFNYAGKVPHAFHVNVTNLPKGRTRIRAQIRPRVFSINLNNLPPLFKTIFKNKKVVENIIEYDFYDVVVNRIKKDEIIKKQINWQVFNVKLIRDIIDNFFFNPTKLNGVNVKKLVQKWLDKEFVEVLTFKTYDNENFFVSTGDLPSWFPKNEYKNNEIPEETFYANIIEKIKEDETIKSEINKQKFNDDNIEDIIADYFRLPGYSKVVYVNDEIDMSIRNWLQKTFANKVIFVDIGGNNIFVSTNNLPKEFQKKFDGYIDNAFSKEEFYSKIINQIESQKIINDQIIDQDDLKKRMEYTIDSYFANSKNGKYIEWDGWSFLVDEWLDNNFKKNEKRKLKYAEIKKIVNYLITQIFQNNPIMIQRIERKNGGEVDYVYIPALPTTIRVIAENEVDDDNFCIESEIIKIIVRNLKNNKIIRNNIEDNDLWEIIENYFKEEGHYKYYVPKSSMNKEMIGNFNIIEYIWNLIRKIFQDKPIIKKSSSNRDNIYIPALPKEIRNKIYPKYPNIIDLFSSGTASLFYEIAKMIRNDPTIKKYYLDYSILNSIIEQYFINKKNFVYYNAETHGPSKKIIDYVNNHINTIMDNKRIIVHYRGMDDQFEGDFGHIINSPNSLFGYTHRYGSIPILNGPDLPPTYIVINSSNSARALSFYVYTPALPKKFKDKVFKKLQNDRQKLEGDIPYQNKKLGKIEDEICIRDIIEVIVNDLQNKEIIKDNDVCDAQLLEIICNYFHEDENWVDFKLCKNAVENAKKDLNAKNNLNNLIDKTIKKEQKKHDNDNRIDAKKINNLAKKKVENDNKNKKRVYIDADYENANKICKNFKRHFKQYWYWLSDDEFSDCLRIAYKERILKEELEKMMEYYTSTPFLAKYIKTIFKNSPPIVDEKNSSIDFEFNSLPDIIKKRIIPRSIDYDYLADEIIKFIKNKIKCKNKIKRDFVKICLNKVLGLKHSYFIDDIDNKLLNGNLEKKDADVGVKKNDIGRKNNFIEDLIDDRVNNFIKNLNECIKTRDANGSNIYDKFTKFFHLSNKEKQELEDLKKAKHLDMIVEGEADDLESVNDEMIEDIKKDGNDNKEINDQDFNNIVYTLVKNLFRHTTPIIDYCSFNPSKDNRKPAYFVPHFLVKSLPKAIKKNLCAKELIPSNTLAKIIVEMLRNEYHKKNRDEIFWLKKFIKSYWCVAVVETQLNILYNPKFSVPIDTLAFLQFSLDGIEIVKKSDVLKRETNYFVAIDSLNPDIKDLFTQDDSTKVCDVLGSSCIQFDDFIRKFIRFPDKNLLSSLNFKEMKYTKLDIPPKDKNLQEIICYDSDKDVFLQVTNNGLYTPIKREYAAQCLWLGVDYNKGMEVAKSFGLNISESEKDYYQPSLVTLYDMKRKLKFEMLHLHGWYKIPNAPCFYTFIEDKKPNKIIIKKIKDICYRLLSFSESESTFKIKDLPHPKQMLVEKSEKGEPLAFYNFFPIKAKDVWKEYLLKYGKKPEELSFFDYLNCIDSNNDGNKSHSNKNNDNNKSHENKDSDNSMDNFMMNNDIFL